ncbi:MAG: DUF4238 domain-containing protein [Alphaproteobacteria bacterium]
MAKHHYVARTYLKHFGDPQRKGMLNAFKKPDAKTFTCWPADVCHEWDGDLNAAFIKHRPELLGDFRQIFEPKWDAAVEQLRVGKGITPDDKFMLTGYMAHLMTCTPSWRRLGTEMYSQDAARYLSLSKEMQQKSGIAIPDLPVDAIELMEAGEIELRVDPDYVKAIVTKQLIQQCCLLYHQDWAVLHNETEFPFLTSDNPCAFLESDRAIGIPTRIWPITPRVAISVRYNPDLGYLVKSKVADVLARPLSSRVSHRAVNADEARRINILTVKCAEELVFSSTANEKLAAVVAKYGRYRIAAEDIEVPSADGDGVIRGTVILVSEKSAPEDGADRSEAVVSRLKALAEAAGGKRSDE